MKNFMKVLIDFYKESGIINPIILKISKNVGIHLFNRREITLWRDEYEIKFDLTNECPKGEFNNSIVKVHKELLKDVNIGDYKFLHYKDFSSYFLVETSI